MGVSVNTTIDAIGEALDLLVDAVLSPTFEPDEITQFRGCVYDDVGCGWQAQLDVTDLGLGFDSGFRRFGKVQVDGTYAGTRLDVTQHIA